MNKKLNAKDFNGDNLCFNMNQSKWNSLYGLYKKSNAARLPGQKMFTDSPICGRITAQKSFCALILLRPSL